MPLVVHFLNVGQGDCTIIQFPSGRVGIVDIDNLKVLDVDTAREMLETYHQSMDFLIRAQRYPKEVLDEAFLRGVNQQLTDPLAYYDRWIGWNQDIFRFIATHPDMDHITGLHRLHVEEPNKSILNFWHTGTYDFKSGADWTGSLYDKRDWDTYRELVHSSSSPKSLKKGQGDSGSYWTEDEIELWAPTRELEALAIERVEPNILSMILKISYRGVSIVLGGDATTNETWPAIYPHLDMTGVNVLKASHHGRKSGYYWPAVKEMSPWLTVTSVGEVAHDATDNYRRYSTHTVSLRDAGDIQITVHDDGRWSYSSNVAQHWKPKLEN
jgi:beta-lactamase superfamily II metal-dependent hydrolase